MNKHLVTIIALAAFAGLSFASCSKPGSSSSSATVVGTWTMQRQATDNNGNGIADASEWSTAASQGITLATLTVNSGGSGSEHYKASFTVAGTTYNIDTMENFTWALENSNTYIAVTQGGTTTHMHLDTLTANLMTTKDTTGGTASWTSFTR